MWEHYIRANTPPAKPFSSTTAADAIRTAIVTNSNTGDKVASSLSSRIAARKTSARKGKGRFAAKAAAKVDEIILEYLDFLDVCTNAAELREVAEHEHMLLARVTKVLGGGSLQIQTQEGGADVAARIPGHLRAKGKVSHKRHMAHVFGVGDVVIVEHGDVKGKFDSPALLAHLEGRFRACDFVLPAHFFSSSKDATVVALAAAAGEGETWIWDHSAEAAALEAKRTGTEEVAAAFVPKGKRAAVRSGAGGGAAAGAGAGDDDDIVIGDI